MRRILFLICVCVTLITSSQSLQHPTIFVTDDERADILQLIEEYDWAKSIKLHLHKEVDAKLYYLRFFISYKKHLNNVYYLQ